MFWWGLVVRACARGRSCDEVLDDGGAGKNSPAAGGDAGGRRGRHSHVNLQFSCSFFLQGEEAPNGRLCERAGRGDMPGAAWETPDSALGGDCNRRWNLLGGCCPESCSWERQLQAGGGGFRGLDGFAEVLSLLGCRGTHGCGTAGGGRAARGGNCVVTFCIYQTAFW
jgi:hypothetical protein